MPNQQTITELTALQNGATPTQVSFKTRVAVKTAHREICGGVTNLENTMFYTPVLIRAIADENSR